MSCRHDFRSVVKMIAAPETAVRRSCDVAVGSYLAGDTASGDRAIRKQLAVSGRIELVPSVHCIDVCGGPTSSTSARNDLLRGAACCETHDGMIRILGSMIIWNNLTGVIADYVFI